jgi:hypothetical protein
VIARGSNVDQGDAPAVRIRLTRPAVLHMIGIDPAAALVDTTVAQSLRSLSPHHSHRIRLRLWACPVADS